MGGPSSLTKAHTMLGQQVSQDRLFYAFNLGPITFRVWKDI